MNNLIWEARLTAISYLAAYAGVIVVLISLWKALELKETRRSKERQTEEWRRNEWARIETMRWAIFIFFLIIGLWIIGGTLLEMLTGFFNPDYWVLEKTGRAFK